MESLNELRKEIETLRLALSSKSDEVEKLKRILNKNLPNWEASSGKMPTIVDSKATLKPLSKTKLTKGDIER